MKKIKLEKQEDLKTYLNQCPKDGAANRLLDAIK